MSDALTPVVEVYRREIKSYVVRAGRMSPRQQRGLEVGWPRFGLELAAGLLVPEQVFGRRAPCTLEIGFGMGQSLLSMAQASPEHNYIGVEVHPPGVGSLLADLVENQIENVRLYRGDALEVLRQAIPDNSLDRVLLFFPDPWHKSRHHKRRIVQPAWAELVRCKLRPGGVLHMATDWQAYAEHMLEIMSAAPGFRNQAGSGGFIERPAERPVTKFERRGERLGHGVWDLKFEKIAESASC